MSTTFRNTDYERYQASLRFQNDWKAAIAEAEIHGAAAGRAWKPGEPIRRSKPKTYFDRPEEVDRYACWSKAELFLVAHQIGPIDPSDQPYYDGRLRKQRDLATDLGYGYSKGYSAERLAHITRVGTDRLGPPSESDVKRLRSIQNLDWLDYLSDRVLDCDSWDALLEGVPK